MYPPGWYVDPTTGTAWRWWDGGRWTDRIAPFSAPRRTRSGLPTVTQWFDATMSTLRTVARELWWRLGLAWLVVGLCAAGVAVAAAVSDEGRTIRDALGLDDGLVFSDGGAVTDADLDRAGDALGDLAVGIVPWLGAVGLLAVVVACWTVAAVAAVARSDEPVDGHEAVRSALGRAPAVAGAWIVVTAVVLSAAVLLAAPALAAWIGGADGVSVAILALFGLLGAVVVVPFLGGRFALAAAFAALGRHGVGIAASWNATAGRFWPVVGRVVLAGLLAGAVTGAAGSLLGVLQLVDLVAHLVAVVAFQAVAALVQTAVLVSAQVVLIGHVADLDRGADGVDVAGAGPASDPTGRVASTDH